jgi:hypothetical protein
MGCWRRVWGIAAIGLTLTGGCAGTVSTASDAGISRDIAFAEAETVFRRAVAEHGTAAEELAGLGPYGRVPMGEKSPFTPWSLWMGVADATLNRSEELERYVARLRAARYRGEEADVAPRLRAAAEFLEHADPRYRTVACEVLCHFPVLAVELGFTPRIGRLLDDQAAPFAGVDRFLTQKSMGMERRKDGVNVAVVARMAMVWMTTLDFANADAFATWWVQNRDYRSRVWYWQARWRRTKPGEDWACLADVDPAEGLKFIVLAQNDWAVTAEAERAFEVDGIPPMDKPVRYSRRVLHYFDPPGRVVADYVRKHGLRPTVLAILRGEIKWECVQDNQIAQRAMLSGLMPALRAVLTQADVPLLEEMLAGSVGVLRAEPSVDLDVLELAIDLDPAGAERMLLAHWKRRRGDTFVAARLIRLTGLKYWEYVKFTCRDKSSPRVLLAVGGVRSPVAAGVLRELFRRADCVGPLQWDMRNYDRQRGGEAWDMLKAFADAAKVFNDGKAVVTTEDLARARTRVRIKEKPTREDKAYNAGVPDIRVELSNRLHTFFSAAAKSPPD